jgi:hypothetical protein
METMYAIIESEFGEVCNRIAGAPLLEAARNLDIVMEELEAEGYVLIDSGEMENGWFRFYQTCENDLGRMIHIVREEG